jgi:L-amino acid N-acyltransferase YncA
MEVQKVESKYPKTEILKDGSKMEIRVITKDDIPAIIDYFAKIPEKERLYHRVNMFEEEPLTHYCDIRLNEGRSITLLGFVDKTLAGIVSLHQATASGAYHVGYIRLSVSPLQRSKGIASILAKEIFNAALFLKLEKVCAEIVAGQEVAKAIFEKKLGFKEEAIRIDHVKDAKGRYHNLIILYNNTKELLEEITRRAVFSSVVYGQEH